ncbi:GLPGLI family protein [Spirosoma rhododendri]|uniref:GLPGLI family protein n=1 Tax=Spirosoma rhododendri TaxID=2728024 RepID=A0A7L5DLU2_9BACT|nr:GLPGLI family protein [Spirosoma rhododendri]QJD77408.1 GLPGLI family protein [Spirosoma rhododendri]
MYRLLIGLLLLSLPSLVMAQKTEGVVEYRRITHWNKIYSRMTYLSQEQKDRIMLRSKNWEDDNKGEKMKLLFTPTQSLYTYSGDASESQDEGYSWRQSELIMTRNFEKERQMDIMEMLGRVYIVEDSLRTPTWKIGNQIKDVAGYICMKAETTDPIKNQTITAWFAQDIPVSAGPERMSGLPGLILELDLNDGDVEIIAQSVTFRPVTADDLKLPKTKGKKITDADYNAMVKKKITESITAHENPYWSIRY